MSFLSTPGERGAAAGKKKQFIDSWPRSYVLLYFNVVHDGDTFRELHVFWGGIWCKRFFEPLIKVKVDSLETFLPVKTGELLLLSRLKPQHLSVLDMTLSTSLHRRAQHFLELLLLNIKQMCAKDPHTLVSFTRSNFATLEGYVPCGKKNKKIQLSDLLSCAAHKWARHRSATWNDTNV